MQYYNNQSSSSQAASQQQAASTDHLAAYLQSSEFELPPSSSASMGGATAGGGVGMRPATSSGSAAAASSSSSYGPPPPGQPQYSLGSGTTYHASSGTVFPPSRHKLPEPIANPVPPTRFESHSPYHVSQMSLPNEVVSYREDLKKKMEAKGYTPQKSSGAGGAGGGSLSNTRGSMTNMMNAAVASFVRDNINNSSFNTVANTSSGGPPPPLMSSSNSFRMSESGSYLPPRHGGTTLDGSATQAGGDGDFDEVEDENVGNTTRYPEYSPPPPVPSASSFNANVTFDSLGNTKRPARGEKKAATKYYPPLNPRTAIDAGDDEAGEMANEQQLLAFQRERNMFARKSGVTFGRGGSFGGGSGNSPAGGATRTPRYVPFAVKKLGHDEPHWEDTADAEAYRERQRRLNKGHSTTNLDLKSWDVTTAEVVEEHVTLPDRRKDYTLEYKTKRRLLAYDDDAGFTFMARPMTGTLEGLRFIVHGTDPNVPPPPPPPPAEEADTASSSGVDEFSYDQRTTAAEQQQLDKEEINRLLEEVNTSLGSDATDVVTIGKHIFVFSKDRQRAMRFNPNAPSKATGTVSGVWDCCDFIGATPPHVAPLVVIEKMPLNVIDKKKTDQQLGGGAGGGDVKVNRNVQHQHTPMRKPPSVIAMAAGADGYGSSALTTALDTDNLEVSAIVTINSEFVFYLDLASAVKYQRLGDRLQPLSNVGGGLDSDSEDPVNTLGGRRSGSPTTHSSISVETVRPTFRWLRSKSIEGYEPMNVGFMHTVHDGNALYVRGQTNRRHAVIRLFGGETQGGRPISPMVPVATMLRSTPTTELLYPISGAHGIAINPQGHYTWVYGFLPAARNWVPLHRLDDCVSPVTLFMAVPPSSRHQQYLQHQQYLMRWSSSSSTTKSKALSGTHDEVNATRRHFADDDDYEIDVAEQLAQYGRMSDDHAPPKMPSDGTVHIFAVVPSKKTVTKPLFRVEVPQFCAPPKRKTAKQEEEEEQAAKLAAAGSEVVTWTGSSLATPKRKAPVRAASPNERSDFGHDVNNWNTSSSNDNPHQSSPSKQQRFAGPAPPPPDSSTSYKNIDNMVAAFPVQNIQKQTSTVIGTSQSELACLCPMFEGCFAILSADLTTYVPAELDRWGKMNKFLHDGQDVDGASSSGGQGVMNNNGHGGQEAAMGGVSVGGERHVDVAAALGSLPEIQGDGVVKTTVVRPVGVEKEYI